MWAGCAARDKGACLLVPAAGLGPRRRARGNVCVIIAGVLPGAAADGRDRCHRRLPGARGARRRGPGPAVRRASRLRHRRPAGQGGRRKPRAGSRRAVGDRACASAQADHRQPVAGRPAQGRVALRPADRAVPAGGDRRDRCGEPVALCRGRGIEPRRADRRVAGRVARRAPCQRAGDGADLPGRAGERGGLGRQCRGAGGAGPAGAAVALQGNAAAAAAGAGRGGGRRWAGRTSSR